MDYDAKYALDEINTRIRNLESNFSREMDALKREMQEIKRSMSETDRVILDIQNKATYTQRAADKIQTAITRKNKE